MKQEQKSSRNQRKQTARGHGKHAHSKRAGHNERILVTAPPMDDIPGQQTTPPNPQELWCTGLDTFATWSGNFVPIARRQVQQTTRLFANSTRETVEVFRKMVVAGQAFSAEEIQSRWTDLWTLSVRALQSNAEIATQIGLRTIDTWISLIRSNAIPQES